MRSLISIVSVDTSFPFGYGYIMQTDTVWLRFVVEINYENRVCYKHGANINHKSINLPHRNFQHTTSLFPIPSRNNAHAPHNFAVN